MLMVPALVSLFDRFNWWPPHLPARVLRVAPSHIPQNIRSIAQSALQSLARQFDAKIIAAARDFNATYVDLFSPFQGRQPELLVPGDVHPDDAGQRLIARLVWRAYRRR